MGTLLFITIGVNGNWFIDGVDSGTPARGEQGDKGDQGDRGDDGATPTISISDDGFWVINGIKTTVPATRPKGDKGDQGDKGDKGDPGECDCDNLNVRVFSESNCVKLSNAGEIIGAYKATITLDGLRGTKIKIVDEQGTSLLDKVLDGEGENLYYPQNFENHTLTITYTLPKSSIEKTAEVVIPKLEYVKMKVTTTENGRGKITVLVEFEEPNRVSSFKEDNSAVVDGQNGWRRVSKGFEKDFAKMRYTKTYTLTAHIGEKMCAFSEIEIPSLETPLFSCEVASFDDCNSVIIITGDEGLTIKVEYNRAVIGEAVPVVGNPKEYRFTVPRKKDHRTYTVLVSKEGYGDDFRRVIIPASEILENPATIEKVDSESDNVCDVYRITNNNSDRVSISFVRGANSEMNQVTTPTFRRDPWVSEANFDLNGGASKEIKFFKDYDFNLVSEGDYRAEVTITDKCGENFRKNVLIGNQNNVRYSLELITCGSENVKIRFTIYDAPPTIYLSYLVWIETVYKGQFTKRTDSNGYLQTIFSMTTEEYNKAIATSKGQFQFYEDPDGKKVLGVVDTTFEMSGR